MENTDANGQNFLFVVCSAAFYIFSCELETFSSKQVFISRACIICDHKAQLLPLINVLCGCCIGCEALVYLHAWGNSVINHIKLNNTQHSHCFFL